MSQASALSETLAKTTSSIGGLLSQIEGSLGNISSSDNLFSNILSENEELDAGAISAPVAVSQTSAAASASTSGDLTSKSIYKNLNQLSSDLKHAIATLSRHKSETAPAVSKAVSEHSSQKIKTNQQATTSSTNASEYTSSTSDSADNSAVSDPQSLAAILAQLLVLTQRVMHDLQKMQSGSSATASTASGAAQSLSDASGASTDSPANPLLQLVAVLEKTAQALQGTTSQNESDVLGTAQRSSLLDESSAASPDDFAKLAADILALTKTEMSGKTGAAQSTDLTGVSPQLTTITSGLQKVLASLQSQKTNAEAALSAHDQDEADRAVQEPTLLTPTASVSGISTIKLSAAQEQKEKLEAETAPAAASVPSTANQAVFTSDFLAAAVAKNTSASNSDTSSNLLDSGGRNASATPGLSENVSAEGAQATGTYTFASTLSAARAVNGGTVGLPSVVDQVILQMNRSVKNGNDQMSLQLQPGDLGKITVKLDFSGDGKVQGTVTADNPQTLSMLQKDSRSLERALQDAGLRTDPGSLQFNLGGQSGQNTGQSANNAGNQSGGVTGTVSADGSGESSAMEVGSIAETYYLTPHGVNIQV